MMTFTSRLLPIAPSIAQLVERWTVVVHCQTSIGRWFKSGSKDFFFKAAITILRKAIFSEGGHFVFTAVANCSKKPG